VELEVLDRLQDRGRIEAIWGTINGLSTTSFFLSWGWIENCLGSLPESIPVRMALISGDSKPVVAFFFGEKESRRKGIFKSRGFFLNSTGSSLCDSLCIEYNSMPQLGNRIPSFKEVLDLLPEWWNEFFLPGLDPSCFPGNCLSEIPVPYKVLIESEVSSPYVDLERVRNEGDYLTLVSSNTRSQLRKAYRMLSGPNGLSLQAAADLGECMEIFGELVELHQKTWAGRGQDGAFGPEYFCKFHRDLITKRFSHGEMQLLRVKSGSITVGCLYNFGHKGRVYFYQSGINYEMDEQLKPGLICQVEAIKYNANLGHAVYDFMAGDKRHRKSPSTHEGRLIWARIQKPSFPFRAEIKLRALKQWGLRAISRES